MESSCKECGADMTYAEIGGNMVKGAALPWQVEVNVWCPSCQTMHFTFVNFDDLVTGK